MKIALIVPEGDIVSHRMADRYRWEEMREYKTRTRLWNAPNLSLLTVASLFPREFSVDYYNLNKEEDKKRVISHIIDSCDLALFSPSTSQVPMAYETADLLRENGVIVLMGGPHVSMLPEETLQHCDAIFIGEAEETIPMFVKDLEENRIQKIYDSPGPVDLSLSPEPRYDLVLKYDYQSIPLQTSRGCPHQCNFCVSSRLYGLKHRRKSFQQIAREIDTITDYWLLPTIFFTDDNMLLHAKSISPVIQYLITKKRVRWYAFSDVSIVKKPHLLEAMAKSGCMQLIIGFESLSLKSLMELNSSKWKMKQRIDYHKIIKTIQSFGIGVVGSFVLGFDEDPPEVFEEIYEFIHQNHVYATNVTILTPFPGTEIYQRLSGAKRLITDDWSKYNGFELTFTPKQFPVEAFVDEYIALNNKLNSQSRLKGLMNHLKTIARKRQQKNGMGSVD